LCSPLEIMTESTAKAVRTVYVASLAALSVLLGAVYSIYNTDLHHWGFILGTALDVMRGRSPFSEVFIQYGVGQPLLLSALSHAMPINLTTIGFIMSAAYALTLVVLFLCLQELVPPIPAALITAIAFLMHPYPTYPWPDYLAGLCLCVACYCMVSRVGRVRGVAGVAPGLFLFAAFLFRNTYLVNIAVSSAAYVALALVARRARCRDVVVAVAVFAVLTSGYFAYLHLQGNLGPWYRQNFGAATDTYGVGTTNIHGLILAVIRPYDLGGLMLTALIASNAGLVFLLAFGKEERTVGPQATPSGIAIFVALLGLCGIVQGLQFYEMFRLQNAGISLYLGFACLLSLWLPSDARASLRIGSNVALGTLAVVLLTGFASRLEGSNWSITWPLIDAPEQGVEGRYSPAYLRGYVTLDDVAIFRMHRFQPELKRYYEDLIKYLCDGRARIVNLTRDSTIPYLCAGQENALSIPFYSGQLLPTISPRVVEAIRRNQFERDEIVVTDVLRGVFAAPSSAGLERIGTVQRPGSIKWLKPAEIGIFRVAPGG
jgi:hypothetical protein